VYAGTLWRVQALIGAEWLNIDERVWSEAGFIGSPAVLAWNGSKAVCSELRILVENLNQFEVGVWLGNPGGPAQGLAVCFLTAAVP